LKPRLRTSQKITPPGSIKGSLSAEARRSQALVAKPIRIATRYPSERSARYSRNGTRRTSALSVRLKTTNSSRRAVAEIRVPATAPRM
jgi:hypothetical protein